MGESPKYPEYEMPQPQVAAHAKHIAEVVFFLYDHLPTFNSVPSLMMEGALALELYLKALNSKTISHPHKRFLGHQLTAAPMKKGHLLDQLYDAINPQILDELRTAYAQFTGSHEPSKLRDALLPYNNLFVDMRYAFEAKGGGGHNITSLVDLVRFFHDHVGTMKKRFGVEAPDAEAPPPPPA